MGYRGMSMKKLIAILAVFCLCYVPAHAQGILGTVFNQKQTQTKRLKEQIAALQVYIDRARKAYKTVQNGLDFIGDLKDGELNLHKDYFNSLKNVKPSVKSYKKIAQILAFETAVVNNCRSIVRDLKQAKEIQPTELQYVDEVLARLLNNCTVLMEELLTVTTSGYFEMKDNERITRIDRLYEAMEDNYKFSQSFSNEARLLVLQRQRDLKDTKTLRSLNNIKSQ